MGGQRPAMPHDITDLRFFVTITESGSLAEAARRLDVTPSAVSQRLRQLESRLGELPKDRPILTA